MGDPVAKALVGAARAIGALDNDEDRVAVLEALLRIYDRDPEVGARASFRAARPVDAEAPKSAAERARAYRERRASLRNSVTDRHEERHEERDGSSRTSVTERDGLRDGERDASRDGRARSLSDSPSQDSPIPEQIREKPAKLPTAAGGAPAESGVQAVTQYALADDAELDAEWAAAARIAGVQDPQAAWAKFRGHHIAKGTTAHRRGWRALFVDKWATQERAIEAKQRARSRDRPVQQAAGAGEFRWQESAEVIDR